MAEDALSSLARWHAVMRYRTDAGLLDDETLLREIVDLHEWIECGPHWDTIERIEIWPINHTDDASLSDTTAQSASADDALSSLARWQAVVYYRADAAPIDVEMHLSEIADLHDRIELGPHCDTI